MKAHQLLVISVTLLASLPALSEVPIGVVDVTEAIFATDAASSRQEDFKQDAGYQQLLAKYERTAADLERLSNYANANASTWSQQEQSEFRQKTEVLSVELRETSDKLDAQIYAFKKNIFDELLPIAEAELQAIVDEREIGLVLKAEAVLMGMSVNDLTAALVERMNRNFPAKQ